MVVVVVACPGGACVEAQILREHPCPADRCWDQPSLSESGTFVKEAEGQIGGEAGCALITPGTLLKPAFCS